jgi:dUTP pyrophosphatase
MPFDLELDRNNSAAGISLYNTAEEVIIPKNIIIIPTGIKVCIDKGWILEIFPRSSYGTKGLIIKNTVGIIDQDYYNNEDNEGHILLKIENTGNTKLLFKGGESYFSQGLFMIYGTAGKQSNNKRNGGFGSTSILSSQVYK